MNIVMLKIRAVDEGHSITLVTSDDHGAAAIEPTGIEAAFLHAVSTNREPRHP